MNSLIQPGHEEQPEEAMMKPKIKPGHQENQEDDTVKSLVQPDRDAQSEDDTVKSLSQPGHEEQSGKGSKKLLTKLGHHPLEFALVAAAAAAVLPFVTALSGEKAVAAHLIGLVMAAVAAKAIWWPGRGDGLLLTGAGILGVLVPILAWQTPVGSAWILLLLSAVVAAAGYWHTFHGDQERPAADVNREQQPTAQD